MKLNIEAIYQNADVVSQSVNGEINRVQISREEYYFLVDYTNNKNEYKGYGDDVIELDYHGEFMSLIKEARKKVTQ